MIERAEFPVQRKRTLYVSFIPACLSYHFRPCSLMEATAAAVSRTNASGFFSDATDTVEPQQELPAAVPRPSGANILTRSVPCAMRGMLMSRRPAASAMLKYSVSWLAPERHPTYALM